MSDNFKFVQAQPFVLYGAGAITGATSIVLKSFTQINGTLLTMSDFGTIGFGTLEPGNGTLEEQISFTGVTQNTNGTATLTGVSTVLNVSPYTQTSGLAQTHAGSTSFVISNTSGFYNSLTGKADDETITGKWTFPSNDPNRAGTGSDVDTADATAFPTFGQLSRVVVAGAPNASTAVKGIVQIPTQAQVDAGTTTGSTGALLTPTPDLLRSKLLSDYVVDTGIADAYVITPSPAIAAYTVGQIFTFKAIHTNTTTSTLNINGLGVKTIKKLDGATNLVAGDIVSGQIIQVEYDGTNFQMLNPSAIAPVTAPSIAGVKFGGTGVDGSLDTSGGTVNIDLANAAVVIKNYTSINVATNNLTFTNPATNGTLIILKSQGNVVISASIVASGLGGQASSNNGLGNIGFAAAGVTGVTGTSGAAAGGAGGVATPFFASIAGKLVPLISGGAGGAGGAGTGAVAGGAGGAGGGALYIECAGALNFSGTITVAGSNGSAGTTSSNTVGGGGGGGGGGGTIAIVYTTLTANSGSLTVTAGSAGAAGSVGSGSGGGGGGGGGGAGANTNGTSGGSSSNSGTGSGGAGGAGGAGVSYVVLNTEFV